MFKAMLFLLAAVGYAIFINLLKPVMSGWLGDSAVGHFIQMVILLGPLGTLLGLFVRSMNNRRRGSKLNEGEEGSNGIDLLWTGRLSLVRSFWFGYIPYALLTALCGNYLVAQIEQFGASEVKWASGGLVAFIVALGFTMFGVWRSGNLYKGRRAWVTLSRVAMIIGLIALSFSMFFWN